MILSSFTCCPLSSAAMYGFQYSVILANFSAMLTLSMVALPTEYTACPDSLESNKSQRNSPRTLRWPFDSSRPRKRMDNLPVSIYHSLYHAKDRQAIPERPQPSRPPAFRIPLRERGGLCPP